MDKKNNTNDLLGIIDNLVDNIQETNVNNTEILNSVNTSLTRISEHVPEIKTVSSKIDELIYNIKIIVAIIGTILTLGMIIIGMYQKNMEDNITTRVSSKIEQSIKQNNVMDGIINENKTISIKK